MSTSPGTMRDWDTGWKNVRATILERDVWLLTDYIKRNYLAPLLEPGARILEVGCGSAKLSALLAERGARVTGMDLSWHAMAAAQRNFEAIGVPGFVLRGDAFHLPFAPNSFDAVTSTGLLEHFENPQPILNEMVRVLRTGGLFFSDVAPLKFSVLRMGMYARGIHRKIRDEYEFNAQDICKWLETADLRHVEVIGSGVVPPLGIVRHLRAFREWCLHHPDFWTRLDGTVVADWLGFFYLARGVK